MKKLKLKPYCLSICYALHTTLFPCTTLTLMLHQSPESYMQLSMTQRTDANPRDTVLIYVYRPFRVGVFLAELFWLVLLPDLVVTAGRLAGFEAEDLADRSGMLTRTPSLEVPLSSSDEVGA